MTEFNPEPPQQQPPEFLRYFKSITQPESDKSSAIATNTIANAGESAVKLADSTIKSSLDENVFEKIERDISKRRTEDQAIHQDAFLQFC